jgi:signal transduction histidine kinase
MELERLVGERTADLEAARREAEAALEHLRAAQAQLVQAEKMASLGEMTAGIAHEIKNPLNFINNFAELNAELADELFDELADDPDIRLADVRDVLDDLKRNAEKINEHGKRADSIVRAMMQHARGGAGTRERVDINTFVEEYLGLAYHGTRATTPDFTAQLLQHLDPEAGDVELGPQELGRVLLNLLSNAFYAVHERAKAANGAYEPKVTVSTRGGGARIEIRISDNGAGIPEEARERIFEPFFTTKPTGSGTGLGLSLSYDIVTNGHGGTLALEDDGGEGATFVITLPASPGAPR